MARRPEVRVTSKELIREFSKYSDMALQSAVLVTKNGRDRLVLINVDEYNLLMDLIDEKALQQRQAEGPSETETG